MTKRVRKGRLLWRRSQTASEASVEHPELISEVSRISGADPRQGRAAAHAVASALQHGDLAALPALSLLLERSTTLWEVDAPSLVNALSAVQFAAMLPRSAASAWSPPRRELAHALKVAVRNGADLAEQATDLLWALVDHRLLRDWMSAELARELAIAGTSTLDAELLLQLAAMSPPAHVEAGEEFPTGLVHA